MRVEKKPKSLTVVLILLVIGISFFVGVKFLLPTLEQPEEEPGVVTQIPSEPDQTQEPIEVQQPKEYVQVVFIGKNENGDEVYKVVKREYDKDVDGSKLRHAITSLVMGPVQKEKVGGIYSEVPAGTSVLHVYDKGDRVIIDLSSGFVYGGGTDSVYKRLFQLIKTVNRNTDKPAYLYIDGKQADVIGGEGIMITQPLSEKSIGE